MILADTSAWVEYDRATGSPVHERMTELMGRPELLAVTEPVRMEVLAGARDDARERQLRRLLDRFGFLPLDPVADFDAAAYIYRRCRRSGVTPRGMVDCLIVSVAWRCEATVLHRDADLARVTELLGVASDPASLAV